MFVESTVAATIQSGRDRPSEDPPRRHARIDQLDGVVGAA